MSNLIEDASFCVLEIQVTNPEILKMDPIKVMLDPTIKKMAKEYIKSNVDISIIFDYWMDGFDFESIGLDYEEAMDIGYGDNREEFLQTFGNNIEEVLESFFDDDNIIDEMVGWGIVLKEA